MTETVVVSVPISEGEVCGFDTGTFYCGYTLRESGGAEAVIEIRDTNALGVILDIVGFSADENVSDFYSPTPLWSNGPLFVVVVSGDLPDGSIRYR